MRASLIKIGNSQGIRIPKPIIAQCGFKTEVEFIVQNNELIVRPVNSSRLNWDSAFQKMAENNDDKLLDSESTPPTEWDQSEWEWK